MSVALVTGSAGLIGSEACRFFASQGFDVAGIDNNMRQYFFGDKGSTLPSLKNLEKNTPRYRHYTTDIRDEAALRKIFTEYGKKISIIIHTAAQPSHDWAAREPLTDFGVNVTGTVNLLELTRQYAPDAVFIYTSTNKVYGDTPNFLPLIEQEKRYEVDPSHPFAKHGIDESMSIDQSLHSVFGAAKASADLYVQEYGKYFGMKTACFRGGCLTGPNHAGAELHGFLSYLVYCALSGTSYSLYGYKGKQVRDNIHSYDLIQMFWHFFQNPRSGEVYNAGGSRHSNCSVLEAIDIINDICGKRLQYKIVPENRKGDHIWYISDVRKFQKHYPQWKYTHDIRSILAEIIEAETVKTKK